mmetsp:Transcript_26220/g.33896  ORF Transcript_26220/g.33896 Transcript_26220/m.33896 type:complete len:674 (-) Transcript_26220:284-2305(-)
MGTAASIDAESPREKNSESKAKEDGVSAPLSREQSEITNFKLKKPNLPSAKKQNSQQKYLELDEVKEAGLNEDSSPSKRSIKHTTSSQSNSSQRQRNFLMPTVASRMRQRFVTKIRKKKKVENQETPNEQENPQKPDAEMQEDQPKLDHNTFSLKRCTVCNMTFSSPARYETHLKYSSLHQKMLDTKVKAEVTHLHTPLKPKPKFDPKQWQILFKGHKFFWRTKTSFDVIIWINKKANIVLVFAYDPGSSKAADKIFLSLDGLKKSSGEDAIRKRVHDETKALPSHIQQNVDEEKRMEEAVWDGLVSYAVNHLKMEGTEDDSTQIVFEKVNGAENLIVDEPADLQIPEINQGRRNSRTDVENNQRLFENDALSVSRHKDFALEQHSNINLALDAAEEDMIIRREKGKHYQEEVNRELLKMKTVHFEAQIQSLQKKLKISKTRLTTALDKNQEELDQAVQDAYKLLDQVSNSDVALCKSINKPKQLLADTFELVLLMMGKTEISWDDAQVLMAGTHQTKFLATLKKMNLNKLPSRKFKAVQDFVGLHPEIFNAEELHKLGKLPGALSHYLKAKYELRLGSRVALEETITKIETDLASLKKEHNAVTDALTKVPSSRRLRRQMSCTGIAHSQKNRHKLHHQNHQLKNAVNGVLFLLKQKKIINTTSTFVRRNSLP